MPGTEAVRLDVDEARPGWAMLTLAGRCEGAEVVRHLGGLLLDLFANRYDLVSIDASGCDHMSPAASQVVVNAGGFVFHIGGRLVVSGPTDHVRRILAERDGDRRITLVPAEAPVRGDS